MLKALTARSIKQPKLTVAIWAILLAVLGYTGLGLGSKIEGTSLIITGSDSFKAAEIEQDRFGRAERVAIVLSGPDRELRKHGPKAVEAVKRLPKIKAVNPWDEDGSGEFLKPNNALVMVDIDADHDRAGDHYVPLLKRQLERSLPAEIGVHTVGIAPFSAEMRKSVVEGSKKAEIAAAPILIVVLLLIFRSVFAAALPLLLGLFVLVSGKGVLALLANYVQIESVSVAVMSVVGLALGVDYCLILVSRFREEFDRCGNVVQAVQATVETAGATTVTAGAIVAVGMGLVALILPGSMLIGACSSVAGAALLSVAIANTLLPALLVLFGGSLDRFSWGQDRSGDRKYQRFVKAVVARPKLATAATLIPLLILTVPAFALKTGPPDVRQLPDSNQLVKDTAYFESNYGKGWMAPFVVVIKRDSGPVTDTRTLRHIGELQEQLVDRSDVAMVIGPAALRKPAGSVRSQSRKAPRQIDDLSEGLQLANDGVDDLRIGLAQAAVAAGTVNSASGQALSGSRQLQQSISQAGSSLNRLDEGLAEIQSGSTRLSSSITDLERGTASLEAAAKDAASGADKLAGPAAQFQAELESTQAQIAKLPLLSDRTAAALKQAQQSLSALPDSTKSDANFQAAQQQLSSALELVEGSSGVNADSFTSLASGLKQTTELAALAATQAQTLSAGAQQLSAGLKQITTATGKISSGASGSAAGSNRLSKALKEAKSGSGSLSDGASELAAGAGRLSGGIGELERGSGSLRSGLADGSSDSRKLGDGINRLDGEVDRSRKRLNQTVDGSASERKLAQQRIADSGYLTLAALAGSDRSEREAVERVVNASRGGDTARMVVIPKGFAVDSPGLDRFLHDESESLSKAIDGEALVGGSGAILNTYRDVTNGKQMPVIVLISLVTVLFLTVVFRSPLLAVKAMLLNLLVVGVVFGVLALLLQGESPLLGGPGYLDGNIFFMIYGVVFTLSMDYEIFMINRMREGYLLTGSNSAAIDYGISKSASVITGAAVIMAGVFLSFALFGIGGVKIIGVGLALAVMIDASIVRLVLLPATMRLFGDANWWIPGWLDRLLPKVSIGSH